MRTAEKNRRDRDRGKARADIEAHIANLNETGKSPPVFPNQPVHESNRLAIGFWRSPVAPLSNLMNSGKLHAVCLSCPATT
jgi:hypothetical protein